LGGAGTHLDWFLVLLPIFFLAFLLLFCFAGCSFDSEGAPPIPELHPDLISHWALDEAPGTTTAKGAVDGTYTTATVEAGSMDGDGIPSPASASPPLLELGAPGLLEAVPDKTSIRVDGGHVTVPFDASLNPPEFTIAVWVHPEWEDGEQVNGLVPFRCVVASRHIDGNGRRHGYALYAGNNPMSPGQHWQVWIGDGQPGGWNKLIGPRVEADQTTHLAVTCKDGVVRLYVDGTRDADHGPLPGNPVETPYESTLPAYSPNATNPLFIGIGAPELDAPLFPFKGRIQALTLYKSALTGSVIDSHVWAGQISPE
jgi:hypothetical protein